MALPNPATAFAAALLTALSAAGVPARADTLPDLAALSDQSAGEQSGIALARQQADEGQLLQAIATLERTLAANPKSDAARLLHALYLCRIDDRTGGAVEIGKLKAKKYAAQDLAQVRAQCGLPERG